MCDRVVVRLAGREDQWCETAGKLATVLDMHPRQIPAAVIDGPTPYALSWNECLCHVDFKALAKLKGLRCAKPTWEGDHIGEWVISA